MFVNTQIVNTNARVVIPNVDVLSNIYTLLG